MGAGRGSATDRRFASGRQEVMRGGDSGRKPAGASRGLRSSRTPEARVRRSTSSSRLARAFGVLERPQTLDAPAVYRPCSPRASPRAGRVGHRATPPPVRTVESVVLWVWVSPAATLVGLVFVNADAACCLPHAACVARRGCERRKNAEGRRSKPKSVVLCFAR